MDFKLGVIGFGNMGSAIVNGFISKNLMKKEDIVICDENFNVRNNARNNGFEVYETPKDLADNADIVLIAVKPVSAKVLLNKIGNCLRDKLLISIVAGLEVKTIKTWTDNKPRVLRVMPNTPAIVGEGVFALDSGTDATVEEEEKIEEIFSGIGLVEWVEEKLFPAVTGLSGGGPAYVAMLIEALADAGVLHGLKRDTAIKISAKTVFGSAAQILDTNIHPAVLKDMVCSPAGTTIEGVKVLEEYGFRSGIIDAVSAAALKAKN